MTISKKIIRELENTYRMLFPNDLKRYLLVKYSEEPFPYEYSEQDLYTNIWNDVNNYKCGKLNVTIKSPSERWKEEREYLQNLYIEKFCEARDLAEYVAELEHILSQHNLQSSRMSEQQLKYEDRSLF